MMTKIREGSSSVMKKTRKEIIETIQLITSIIALSVTIMSLVKRFMDWSEN